MFRSKGARVIAVGLLTLLMFIPLGLASDIIEERATYNRQTVADISREWGGAQDLSGPLLIVPVTEDVTYDRRREAVDSATGLALTDKKGNPVYEHYQETVTERRAPLFIYPETLDVALNGETRTRYRGVFSVPVYTAAANIRFAFDASAAGGLLRPEEVPHWDETTLEVYLTSNRGLRGAATLTWRDASLTLEPIADAGNGQTGIRTAIGDPRDGGDFALALTLNGAQHMSVAATGRTTRVVIDSDWPDPGFFGSFLPDASEVSETGFRAEWTVPHLARSLPQVSRENLDPLARKSAAMGVRFVTPNDFYQKAYRSARYGILFIGLTFLTILLVERQGDRPAHPVQYLMVGLAQAVFVLLMVSFAEQIGFGAAYALAAAATVGLLTVYGAVGLKLGKGTRVLGATLVLVYGVLYLILRSSDYALLAGSLLAFAALAATMFLTRNEDWHGPEGPRRPWFRRRAPETPPVPA